MALRILSPEQTNYLLKKVCLQHSASNRIVRSPSVANLDSRLLVNTSDLAKAKVRNMKLGDAAFNVDEFVAKLVSFMGGRHRFRGTVQAEGRDEDNMDWAKVGHMASTICRRPPTIGFMLGPLSVEKKERKVTKRQANNRNDAEVVRPQEVLHPSSVLINPVKRR